MSTGSYISIPKPPPKEKKARKPLKRSAFKWKPDAAAVARMRAWNRQRTAIPKKSAKQAAKDREWAKSKAIAFERSGGMCVVGSPDCEFIARDGGHRKPRGRGGNNTPENCDPTCGGCHAYLHDHSEWAEAHGFMLSQFQPEAA